MSLISSPWRFFCVTSTKTRSYRARKVGLFFQGLIPGITRFLGCGPRSPRNRFDGLHGDLPFLTEPHHRIEILAIVLVLVHDVIVGQENGIKVEPLQAAPMHGGNGPA